MKPVDKILATIANLCVMNLEKFTTVGLNGKDMRVLLFLYEYSRYASAKEYSDEADEMFGRQIGALRHKCQTLEDAAVIGLSLDYLIKAGYMTTSDPIEDIVRVLIGGLPEKIFPDARKPWGKDHFWPGLHLLVLLKYAKADKRLFAMACKSLGCIDEIYRAPKPVPLSATCGLLYYVKALKWRNVFSDMADDTAGLIHTNMRRYYHECKVDCAPAKFRYVNDLLNCDRMPWPWPGRGYGGSGYNPKKSGIKGGLWAGMLLTSYENRDPLDPGIVEALLDNGCCDPCRMPRLIEAGLYMMGFDPRLTFADMETVKYEHHKTKN